MKQMFNRKMMQLRILAKCDRKYRDMEQNFMLLEEKFLEMVSRMTEEQQNLVWAFVFASEELDLRLFEIACEGIH